MPVQKYGSRKIVTAFSKITCKREELDTYLKKIFGKHEAPTIGARAAEKHARTEKKVTTVNEPIGLLSQEGQKQTRYSARHNPGRQSNTV